MHLVPQGLEGVHNYLHTFKSNYKHTANGGREDEDIAACYNYRLWDSEVMVFTSWFSGILSWQHLNCGTQVLSPEDAPVRSWLHIKTRHVYFMPVFHDNKKPADKYQGLAIVLNMIPPWDITGSGPRVTPQNASALQFRHSLEWPVAAFYAAWGIP